MNIIAVETDDYIAVYLNGQQVYYGHSVSWEHMVEMLGAMVTTYSIEDPYEGEEYDWLATTFDPAMLPPSAV